MKKDKRIEEYKNKTKEELEEIINDLKRQKMKNVRDLGIDQKTGKGGSNKQKEIRKEIARIKTILNWKKKNE